MILWVPIVYFVYSQWHREKLDLRNCTAEQIEENKVPWIYAIVVFGYFICF
jgi:hypothetical protein